MLSSTNPTKRPPLGVLGLATGIVATCMSFASLAHAQDECSTATTAIVGANPFNTATATASANPPTDALCTGTFLNWTAAQKDVWFAFTPGSAGALSVTTCLAGSYDTSIAIYEGTTCGNAVLVACNGDDPTADGACQLYYSTVSNLFTDATSTYYIRLGGYEGETGTGTLTLSFQAATYEACLTSTDSCAEVHVAGGCADTACCESVCATYPPCCESTWEQLCVDLAIDACGIFIYNCTGSAYSNDCATAAMVVADGQVVPYNTTGANTDGPNEAGCNSGNNDLPIWSDLWYRFTSPANGFATATNCFTGNFDTKIAFYDVGDWSSFDPQQLPELFMACNEDCPVDPAFASEQTVQVAVGRTYLVRLGGYEAAVGAGTITFSLPGACALGTPSVTEGEPCGDSTNPGCMDDNTTVAATTLPLNTLMGGNFWADGDFRDTDWYKITITEASEVTVELLSSSLTSLFVLSGSPCDENQLLLASGSASTCPMTASVCLNPGDYYVFVAIDGFSGTPCDTGIANDYSLKVTTAPGVCPTILGAGCANPGPDNVTQSNSDVIETWNTVACWYGAGNGSSADNTFAQVVPMASVDAGELRCISFGVINWHWTAPPNAGGLVEPSASMQTAFLRLYRDLNGGAPTFPVEEAGGDMELITEWELLVPGGWYVGTISLDTPMCLDGNTQNLVVVLHCPAPVPVSTSNIELIAGGNVAGPASVTYRRSQCAPTAAFALYAPTGAALNWNWYVNLNGNFTSCGADCPADLNDDGVVNGGDIGLMLGAWGVCPGCPADLDDNGVVNGADIGLLLGAWGPCS